MSNFVSDSSDTALRLAAKRLLEGTPVRTTGALTVANLAREAGVSRATANRAKDVLDEFGAAVELRASSVREASMRRSESELLDLRRKLGSRNAEVRTLRDRCSSYAQEIQSLYFRQQALEREVALLRKRLETTFG